MNKKVFENTCATPPVKETVAPALHTVECAHVLLPCPWHSCAAASGPDGSRASELSALTRQAGLLHATYRTLSYALNHTLTSLTMLYLRT